MLTRGCAQGTDVCADTTIGSVDATSVYGASDTTNNAVHSTSDMDGACVDASSRVGAWRWLLTVTAFIAVVAVVMQWLSQRHWS